MNPTTHVYTLTLPCKKYEVTISPSTNYGYFESYKHGDADGGGLWFEVTPDGIELVDYDGVFSLPKAVAESLIAAGYIVDDCCV